MAFAYPTLLLIKKAVSSQLGKTDYATPSLDRDILINEALREVLGAHHWAALKKSSTLTITAGIALWPDDYDPGFDTGQIYSYSGTTKTKWTQLSQEDLGLADPNNTSSPAYALDFQNARFNSSLTSASPTFTYYALPPDPATDGTADATAIPMTMPTFKAVVYRATAALWLGSERDETNHDRFMRLYAAQLRRAITLDGQDTAPSQVKHSLKGYDLGFNRPRS